MTLPRRVCYLTGTRADFGLMVSTLHAIRRDPRFSLSLIVTGMHLSDAYGRTVREVEAEGFDIAARVPVDLSDATGAAMARGLGTTLVGAVDALERIKPDVLLLLGDRGEMLAGALAAIHLGVPIAHLHGGERSGTVDEPVRHAISKLAHLHLVATTQSRDRLIRLGEQGAQVHVTGAPGLDGLAALATESRQALCAEDGFDPTRPVALFVYHPVLHEAGSAGLEASLALSAAVAAGCQVLAMMPNADAGSQAVREALMRQQGSGRVVVKTHLPRPRFVSWMAVCDVMMGNSSSGIIEAATFGTPVINIGSRQNLRERNDNVADVVAEPLALQAAIESALRAGRRPCINRYGDGQAAHRIVESLASLERTDGLMAKSNAY
ncbi:MAG: UDP-N-acetylglucosamine 2-epimerase (hydrolyzing) [Rhizobacter sp.]|nr:UDP-N-acetylglucosamine 2-epimerase (hydrolyzing) [Rhizobacter sp.]